MEGHFNVALSEHFNPLPPTGILCKIVLLRKYEKMKMWKTKLI